MTGTWKKLTTDDLPKLVKGESRLRTADLRESKFEEFCNGGTSVALHGDFYFYRPSSLELFHPEPEAATVKVGSRVRIHPDSVWNQQIPDSGGPGTVTRIADRWFSVLFDNKYQNCYQEEDLEVIPPATEVAAQSGKATLTKADIEARVGRQPTVGDIEDKLRRKPESSPGSPVNGDGKRVEPCGGLKDIKPHYGPMDLSLRVDHGDPAKPDSIAALLAKHEQAEGEFGCKGYLTGAVSSRRAE